MEVSIYNKQKRRTIMTCSILVVALVLGCSTGSAVVSAEENKTVANEITQLPKLEREDVADIVGADETDEEEEVRNAVPYAHTTIPTYFEPRNPIKDYGKLLLKTEDDKLEEPKPFSYSDVVIMGPTQENGAGYEKINAYFTSLGAGVNNRELYNTTTGKMNEPGPNGLMLDPGGPSSFYLPGKKGVQNGVGGMWATYKGKPVSVYLDVDNHLSLSPEMRLQDFSAHSLMPLHRTDSGFALFSRAKLGPPSGEPSGFDVTITCVDPVTQQIIDADLLIGIKQKYGTNFRFKETDIKDYIISEEEASGDFLSYETIAGYTTFGNKFSTEYQTARTVFRLKNGVTFRYESDPKHDPLVLRPMNLLPQSLDIDYFPTPTIKGKKEDDELLARYTVQQDILDYFNYRYDFQVTYPIIESRDFTFELDVPSVLQLGKTPAALKKQFTVKDGAGRVLNPSLDFKVNAEGKLIITIPRAVLVPLENSQMTIEAVVPVNEEAENLTDYLKNGYLEIPMKVANNDHPTESEGIAKVRYSPLPDPVVEAKLSVAPSSINVGSSAVYTAEIKNSVEPSLPWNWTNAIYKTSPFPVGVTPDLTSIKINGTKAVGTFDESSRTLSVALGDNLSSATEVSYTVSTAENVIEQTVTQQATVTASEGTVTTNQADLTIKGLLKIASAPTKLDFGQLKLDYTVQTISNPEYNEALVVSDTRGASGNGWKLYAKASIPMTHETDESSVLVDALRYVSNGEELILSEGNQLIDQSATSVAKNISDTWGNQPTSDGVKLVVDPEKSKVVVGAYKGQITWQLMQGEP